MPLGYVSVIEALQAYAYVVVNDCELPANQLVTYFSYLHIVFQPFFINALSLHFIPAPVARNCALELCSLLDVMHRHVDPALPF